MVTYGDYFSRRVLHDCGVSPDKALFEKDGKSYIGGQRTDKIRSDMSEIYQTLYRGYTERQTAQRENFADLQAERKIVAAFYDSGILSKSEREYFQSQSLQETNEREQICVQEASLSVDAPKMQKVDAPIKAPLVRDV